MADLGKVGITYDKNGYVATTPYEPLTVLKYTDGGTYMSILPTTGHLPTDATYWACMVPPIEAEVIDYTPLERGVITNTTVQGAIEQADRLKFNKVNVVQTNINHAWKVPSSALLYATKNEINDSLNSEYYQYINRNDVDNNIGTITCLFEAPKVFPVNGWNTENQIHIPEIFWNNIWVVEYLPDKVYNDVTPLNAIQRWTAITSGGSKLVYQRICVNNTWLTPVQI